jgi:hypothetical protein
VSRGTGWEPTTDGEVALYDALVAGDQERYFRALARIDLLLPVSSDAVAGRSPMGWATWTSSDHTHLLAFTSEASMRTCLAEHAGAARRLSLPGLAAVWPNQDWWLAVNPGLPIEGYLPPWFVAQLGRGDARLPGQGPSRLTDSAPRDRLERVRALERAKAARAAAGVESSREPVRVVSTVAQRAALPPASRPDPLSSPLPPATSSPLSPWDPAPFAEPEPWDKATPDRSRWEQPTAEPSSWGKPGSWSEPTSAPAPPAYTPPARSDSARTTFDPSAFGRVQAARADAARAAAARAEATAATEEPARADLFGRGATVQPEAEQAREVTGPAWEPRPGPWQPIRATEPWDANPLPKKNAEPEPTSYAASSYTEPARPGVSGTFADGDRSFTQAPVDEAGSWSPVRAESPAVHERPVSSQPYASPANYRDSAFGQDSFSQDSFSQDSFGSATTGSPATGPATTAPAAPSSTSTAFTKAGFAQESFSQGSFGQAADLLPMGPPPSADTMAIHPATMPPVTMPPVSAPPAWDTPASWDAVPEEPASPAAAQVIDDEDDKGLNGRPRHAEPEPDFIPANSVEQQLYEAAEAGNTDLFLSTLLLATILIPKSSGTTNGQWRPQPIEGEPHIVSYTSAQHIPNGLETVSIKFIKLISEWPDPSWSFAVNPGTPVGATLPGGQLLALANWAAEVGLGGDEEEQAAEKPSTPSAGPAPAAGRASPELTVLQKAIAPSQIGYYLDRGYDRVSGFVHRAHEVGHLRSVDQIRIALGLDWEGSPFKPGADEIYLLRWSAYRPNLYRIPYGGQTEAAMKAMQGWVIERAPFRGNGFAPGESKEIIAEFKVDSARLPHGTRLMRLRNGGAEEMIAVLDTDGQRWLRTDGK